MKTILDIPDELLNEAMKLSHSKTKKESVVIALEELCKEKED